MKSYTFHAGNNPTLCLMLDRDGFNAKGIREAVEAHGNSEQGLSVVDVARTGKDTYKPAKYGQTKVTPAESGALNTVKIKMKGDGSDPRYFAGWANDVVVLLNKYGEISHLPYTDRIKEWIGKFPKTPVATVSVDLGNGVKATAPAALSNVTVGSDGATSVTPAKGKAPAKVAPRGVTPAKPVENGQPA